MPTNIWSESTTTETTCNDGVIRERYRVQTSRRPIHCIQWGREYLALQRHGDGILVGDPTGIHAVPALLPLTPTMYHIRPVHEYQIGREVDG
jgi:hypothetical protein